MLESIKLVKISVIKYNDTLSKYDVCVRLRNLTLLYVNDRVGDKYYTVTFLPTAPVLTNCIDYLCSASMCIKVNTRSIPFDKLHLAGSTRGSDWLLYQKAQKLRPASDHHVVGLM